MPSISLSELLGRHRSDFDDFDIRDIRYHPNPIFINAEMQCITDLPKHERFDKMRFMLEYEKADPEITRKNFMNSLRSDYDWIADRIESTIRQQDEDKAIAEYKSALFISDIPRIGDLFVHRLDYLWDVQQRVKRLQRGEYLIIHSKIGFGKKSLVKDACTDYSVFEVMKNKVYWINLDNCVTDEDIYEKLVKLRIMLTTNDDVDTKYRNIDSNNVQRKIENIKYYLKKVLEGSAFKETLLILCGVNNKKAFNAFDIQCKLLITTKNKSIFEDIKENAKTVIDIKTGFTNNECLELLEKATRGAIPRNQFASVASDIHKRTEGHPFTIAKIAKGFFEADAKMICEEGILSDLKRHLEKISSFTIEDSCVKTIEEGFNKLTEEQKALYKSLYVFKDDANIPCKILEHYWGKTDSEVKEIIKSLHQQGLLEENVISIYGKRPIGNGTINRRDEKKIHTIYIHFLYYSYFKKLLTDTEIYGMHRKLMETYGVTEILHQLEPRHLVDDYYFYYYIGYHLEEANMIELFPKFFFDFEFLELKMRATGLPNTIGDLEMYYNHIKNNCRDYLEPQVFLDHLIDFLPTIEEGLLLYPNTCLLQYAFSSDIPAIHYAAKSQTSKYSNRVWFDSSDHSHKYRQIVQLPETPVEVKFLNHPDAALIALKNNSILLQDLSQYYNADSTVYSYHKSQVKRIEVINNDAFVSLDQNGLLTLWSLTNTDVTKRLSSSRRNSAIDPAIDFSPKQKHRHHDESDGKTDGVRLHSLDVFNFKCISYAETTDEWLRKQSFLVACDKTGLIWFIDIQNNELDIQKATWIKGSDKTEFITIFDTIVNDKKISCVTALHSDGKLSFYNANNSAEIILESDWSPQLSEPPINMHQFTINGQQHLICVFSTLIHELQLEFVSDAKVKCKNIENYGIPSPNKVNCSVLADDSVHLVLGTDSGIKIINIRNKQELPYKNLNEEIASIDITSITPEKNTMDLCHIILSCAKHCGNWVVLQATIAKENRLSWENDRTESPYSEDQLTAEESTVQKLPIIQLTHKQSLLGNTLFEVKDCTIDEISILIPDNKFRVQLRTSKSKYQREFFTKALNTKITAISSTKDSYYVGCEDGSVYQMSPAIKKVDDVIDKVTFLKCCKNGMVLVGTPKCYQLLGGKHEYRREIGACVEIGLGVVVISKECEIDIFDEKQTWQYTNDDLSGKTFCASATASITDGPHTKRLIMIGTTNNHVYISWYSAQDPRETVEDICKKFWSYSLPFTAIKNSYKDHNTDLLLPRVTISSLAISKDASTWAAGFTNGNILIYQMTDIDIQTSEFLYKLQLCTGIIEDLLFSPWTDPNSPLILVSLSREISFWDVKYMVNNPFNDRITSSSKRSQRFKKRSQISPLNANVSTLPFAFKAIQSNLWDGKSGPPDHPQLLSSFRLIGKAKKLIANPDFTQFVTVDNEGEIYQLKLHDKNLESPTKS